jgi:hypothetical protein
MPVALGHDESPGARSALRVAIEMATAYGEPLVIVYGVAAPGVTGEEYGAHHEAVREAGDTASCCTSPACRCSACPRPGPAALSRRPCHAARVMSPVSRAPAS